MDKSPDPPIHHRAKKSIRKRAAAPGKSQAGLQRLVHKLEVHQIELEAQNEQLRRLHGEIEESRAQFADLYDFAPVGYVTLDEQGVIVSANLTACAQLGFERQHIVGRRFAVFARREHRKAFAAHLLNVFKTSKCCVAEIEIERRTGECLYVQLQGIAVESSGDGRRSCRMTITDVTQRHLAEQQIRQKEAQYRRIVETASEGLVITDDRFVICFINARAARALGYTVEEVLGKSFEAFVFPEDVEDQRARIMARQRRGRERYERRLRAKDGRVIWTLVSVTPLLDDNGRFMGSLAMFTDITDRKRAEAMLAAQRDLAMALRQATSLQETLRLCLEAALRVSDMDCGGVYLVEPVSRNLKLACSTGISAAFADAVAYSTADSEHARQVADGESIVGQFGDLTPQMTDAELREGLRATAVVPIYKEGRAIGSINVASHTYDEVPLFASGGLDGIAHEVGNAIYRSQTEEALRQSEERFRELFRHTGNGVAVYEARDHGEVFVLVDINLAGEKISKVARKDAIGRDILEKFPGLRAMGLIDVLQRVWRTGHSEYLPIARYHDDRIEQWVENHVYKLPSGEIVAVYDDVTDRQKAETALRKSEEALNLAVSASGAGVWDWDSTSRRFGSSPRCRALFGVAPESEGGYESFLKALHPDDHARIRSIVREAFEKGAFFSSEFRVIWQDGTVRWIAAIGRGYRDETGKPVRMAGVVLDVTERKRAEDALAESEVRYRSVFEQSPDGITIVDPETWRFLEFNETAHRQLGYSREEFAQLLISDIEADETPEEIRARLHAIRQGHTQSFDTRHRTRQGEIRDVHVTVQKLHIAGHRVHCSIWRDITDSKRAEQSLLEYQGQLRSLASELSVTEERERRRLASYLHDDIGQFLALAKIKLGEVQVLAIADEARALVEEARESIGKAIERTRTMTSELFPPALHQFGLSAALDVLAEEFEQSTGLPVAFQEDDTLDSVDMMTSSLVHRGVREALFNVVKHARATQARISARCDGGIVEVVVEDDGIGFTFVDAQSRRRMTDGFGLFSLAERLRHIGGELRVDSAPGQGARVILRAPIVRVGGE